MSSEDMGLVQSQRLEDNLNSHHHHHHHRHHLVFQSDEALRFSSGAPVAAATGTAATQLRVGGGGGDSAGVPKTRDLSGFIEERFFATPQTDFRRGIFAAERADPRNWNANVAATAAAAEATPSVDGSEDDDDDDDDGGEDEDMDDDDNDNEVVDGKGNACNNRSNGEDIIGNGNGKQKRHDENSQTRNLHHIGVNVTVKESGELPVVAVAKAVGYNNDNGLNVVTVAENDGGGNGYYSQYFHGADGSSASGQKDNNGCGFSGRKESCLYLSESGDSLRSILSDPITGALMDDAMILPCGHSFGGGGVQHVIRMKSCYTCSRTILEDSIAPNLSLRDAVQAFRREEELQFHRSAKRKRERFDQEKSVYGDSSLMDLPRGKGVQFPFAVTDRVVIKGNKRTPPRFVGREAVVTTQCLNGWYVVKTLDNAESVKLQYRSLAKVPEDPLSKPMSSKMAPNWL